jgi:hypothetical protein
MEYDYFVKQRIVVLVLRITDFPKKVFLMQCSDVLLVLESFMTERGQMLGKGWSIPSFWYFTFVSPLSSIKHNVQPVELLLHYIHLRSKLLIFIILKLILYWMLIQVPVFIFNYLLQIHLPFCVCFNWLYKNFFVRTNRRKAWQPSDWNTISMCVKIFISCPRWTYIYMQ